LSALLEVFIFLAKQSLLSKDLSSVFTLFLFVIFTLLIYIAEALSAIIFRLIFYAQFASFLPFILPLNQAFIVMRVFLTFLI